MARICFLWLTTLALVLANAISECRADSAKKPRTTTSEEAYNCGTVAAPSAVCKVYSLADLGNDPNLGPWLVKTIPEFFQHGTWSQPGDLPSPSYMPEKGFVTYYAPAKILVVKHTPAVHKEVEAFLKSIKKATPRPAEAKDTAVVPSDYRLTQAPMPPIPPPPPPLAKESPEPPTPPKHLFHIIVEGLEIKNQLKLKNFTIRYEGEGIIDATVAKLIRSLNKQKAASGEDGISLQTLADGIFPLLPIPQQTYHPEKGLTLPSPHYLRHPPQYFPSEPTGPTEPADATDSHENSLPRKTAGVPSKTATPPASPTDPSQVLPKLTSGPGGFPPIPAQPAPAAKPSPVRIWLVPGLGVVPVPITLAPSGVRQVSPASQDYILGPIPPGSRPICEDPPDRQTILRALPGPTQGIPYIYEEFRDDLEIILEKQVDVIDPPRFYPLIGPAQLHHCHWKCTVYFTEAVESSYPFPFLCKRRRVEVVYIDKDHLHLCPAIK